MKIKLGSAFFVIGLLCVVPVGAYVYFMWYKFGFSQVSSQNADWSAFGSYLGGILSPMFTLVSILFIYYSIRENNRNHKTEMRYLESQQVISMVGSLADAFNAKLDSAVNLAHPLLMDVSINVYETPQGDEGEAGEEGTEVADENNESNEELSAELDVFQVEKTKMKLSDLLEDYMSYRDSKKLFSWQYVNLVNALTHDLVETLNVALAFCSAINEFPQRKDAVMLFNAKTNSTVVTVLFHLLADRVGYSLSLKEDVEDVERIFASAALLSELSENFKYSSVPFLEVLLYQLVVDGFRNTSDEARFEFNRKGDADVVKGDRVEVIPVQKIFEENDLVIHGVQINLTASLRCPVRDFIPVVDVKFSSNIKKYHVEIQKRDPLGLAEALGATPPLFKLTFSLEGLLFNLDELEIMN
jgi:uncharacterized membrane protein